MEVIPRQRAAQLRDKDWEPWKTLIRMKYLNEDKELDELLKELNSLGLHVT